MKDDATRAGREAGFRHVLKYTGIFGGMQGFYILMSVVRGKFAALLIGAGGMGLADLYNRSVEFLGNTTNLGIGFSAVRRLSSLYEEGNRTAMERYVRLIRSWTLLAALLGTLLCLGCAPLLSRLTTGTDAHAASFCLLSLAVGMTTLTGGELAILKGMRQLKQIAANSALGALTTLLVTVPLYAVLGRAGIAPALVGSVAVLLALNLRASCRLFPWRAGFSPRFLRCGLPLLQLGMAYVVAGILGSGAEMLIRSFLVRTVSWAEAGYYSAGFTVTVSYARLIFTAMDADYFPRLAATGGDTVRMNLTVNRQVDVLVLLMAPFLILFSLSLPLVVRILYTEDFLRIVPMVLGAAFYMYFKAVYAPASYLALARGDSTVYLGMELLYDVVFTLFVVAGYHLGGLPGAGVALSAANLFDLLLVSAVYHRRYGFRFERPTLWRVLVQMVLLAAGVGAAALPAAGLRLGLGGVVLCASCLFSWHMLKREMGGQLRQRLHNLWRKRARKDGKPDKN